MHESRVTLPAGSSATSLHATLCSAHAKRRMLASAQAVPGLPGVAHGPLDASTDVVAAVNSELRAVHSEPQAVLGSADEVRILLDRTDGSKLGISIPDSQPGLIADISPGGLVDRWNRTHPALRVVQGDKIVSINGVHDPNLMGAEMRKQEMLHVTLKKAPSSLANGLASRAALPPPAGAHVPVASPPVRPRGAGPDPDIESLRSSIDKARQWLQMQDEGRVPGSLPGHPPDHRSGDFSSHRELPDSWHRGVDGHHDYHLSSKRHGSLHGVSSVAIQQHANPFGPPDHSARQFDNACGQPQSCGNPFRPAMASTQHCEGYPAHPLTAPAQHHAGCPGLPPMSGRHHEGFPGLPPGSSSQLGGSPGVPLAASVYHSGGFHTPPLAGCPFPHPCPHHHESRWPAQREMSPPRPFSPPPTAPWPGGQPMMQRGASPSRSAHVCPNGWGPAGPPRGVSPPRGAAHGCPPTWGPCGIPPQHWPPGQVPVQAWHSEPLPRDRVPIGTDGWLPGLPPPAPTPFDGSYRSMMTTAASLAEAMPKRHWENDSFWR